MKAVEVFRKGGNRALCTVTCVEKQCVQSARRRDYLPCFPPPEAKHTWSAEVNVWPWAHKASGLETPPARLAGPSPGSGAQEGHARDTRQGHKKGEESLARGILVCQAPCSKL